MVFSNWYHHQLGIYLGVYAITAFINISVFMPPWSYLFGILFLRCFLRNKKRGYLSSKPLLLVSAGKKSHFVGPAWCHKWMGCGWRHLTYCSIHSIFLTSWVMKVYAFSESEHVKLWELYLLHFLCVSLSTSCKRLIVIKILLSLGRPWCFEELLNEKF